MVPVSPLNVYHLDVRGRRLDVGEPVALLARSYLHGGGGHCGGPFSDLAALCGQPTFVLWLANDGHGGERWRLMRFELVSYGRNDTGMHSRSRRTGPWRPGGNSHGACTLSLSDKSRLGRRHRCASTVLLRRCESARRPRLSCRRCLLAGGAHQPQGTPASTGRAHPWT